MMTLLRRVAAITLAAGFALSGSPKLSKDLEKAAPESVVDVTVQFKKVPAEVQHKKVGDRGGLLKKYVIAAIQRAIELKDTNQVKARLMKTASRNFPLASVATGPATGLVFASQHDIFSLVWGDSQVWATSGQTFAESVGITINGEN